MFDPRPPFKHQNRALRASMAHDPAFFAYLMDMGTGKSRTDVMDTTRAVVELGVDGWLILAPKGNYDDWTGQVETWMDPALVKTRKVVIWEGGKRQAELRALKDLLTDKKTKLRVLIVNIEAISAGERAVDMCRKFLQSCKRAKITVDESTKIKGYKSIRTKNAIELREMSFMRRILTGMPVTKSPLDVFSQFEFLKEGCLGFKSYYAFRNTYCILKKKRVFVQGRSDPKTGERGRPRSRDIQVVVSYRNLEDLQARVAKHSFRVLKEECLDLPPKVYSPIVKVALTDEQRKYYDEIRDDCETQLASGAFVSAPEVMTQILRLHQVVCGHVKDEEGQLHEIPTNRDDALLEAMEEVNGKGIVWATYRYNLERLEELIKKKFGERSVVRYDGSVHGGRGDLVSRFRTGDADWFLGNPSTGGFGLTLIEATTSLYYSNSFSLEHRRQSEDRPHRAGQTRSCNYVDFVAPGTVDQKVFKTLRANMDVAAAIAGDDWREWVL